ncbi:hypothetical protein J8I26_17135 [Herbaspirillum sp. LeCh32-8]|uniref:hypothetical protein n=1 Tax=Herbaspirillum sp. LeCh32-8 TaxID=2821356 RepID=UPI001AEAAF29|nr:hypothetical protein [Herbaspirillum sp. LeCh32-8]MBP0599838.1 hypothetical protein [Herbaspirillum sp. LeCh32-8]
MIFRYEIKGNASAFTFGVWCCMNGGSWIVSGVEIRHDTIGSLFPKRSLPGLFDSKALALARGIRWCESVAHQLLDAEVPDVPAEMVRPIRHFLRPAL